jgi:hypothetical protein
MSLPPEAVIARPFAAITEERRTDLCAFARGVTADAVEEALRPDAPIRFHVPGGGGLGTMGSDFTGAAGLIAGWREFVEPYEEFVAETGETGPTPDGRVLQLSTCFGRLRGSSSTIEVPTAAIYGIEGEHLTRIDFYLDRDQARRDAGF